MHKKIFLDYELFKNKNPTNKRIELIRERSIKFFNKKGIPTIKDEDWKYTNVLPILDQNFNIVIDNNFNINYDKLKKYFITDVDNYRLVFINGIFNGFLSNITESTNNDFDILNLSLVFKSKKYEFIIQSFYNLSPDLYESFFSLNSAFSNEGTFIHIKKNVILSKDIEIINFTFDNQNSLITHPRTLIVIEDNSKVKIIEQHKNIGKSINLINYVCEIFVQKNSEIEIYKIQNDHLNSNLIDSTSIMQYNKSLVKVYTFSLGSNFTRNNLHFHHQEPDCSSILNGITVINQNQFVDHHTLVDHAMPYCESHEFYRGIFDNTAQGVFNGKIVVRKNAQKVNAFQQNDNLILSNTAIVNAKPQLEIFANDVKCSHGCTIGQLNQDIIFYLQSRGISKIDAIALLNFGFLLDIFKSIENINIKLHIINLIYKKLKMSINLNYI